MWKHRKSILCTFVLAINFVSFAQTDRALVGGNSTIRIAVSPLALPYNCSATATFNMLDRFVDGCDLNFHVSRGSGGISGGAACTWDFVELGDKGATPSKFRYRYRFSGGAWSSYREYDWPAGPLTIAHSGDITKETGFTRDIEFDFQVWQQRFNKWKGWTPEEINTWSNSAYSSRRVISVLGRHVDDPDIKVSFNVAQLNETTRSIWNANVSANYNIPYTAIQLHTNEPVVTILSSPGSASSELAVQLSITYCGAVQTQLVNQCPPAAQNMYVGTLSLAGKLIIDPTTLWLKMEITGVSISQSIGPYLLVLSTDEQEQKFLDEVNRRIPRIDLVRIFQKQFTLEDFGTVRFTPGGIKFKYDGQNISALANLTVD